MTARPVEFRRPRPIERRPLVRGHAVEEATGLHSDEDDEADLERSNQQRWPLLMDVLGRPVPYAGHVAVPLTGPHGPPMGVVSCFLRSDDTGAATTAEAAHALIDLAEPVTHLLSLIAAAEPEHTDATATPPGPAARPSAVSDHAREREARLHVATGMVAVQVNNSPSAALARIRAHAYVTGASVYAVARDVVSGRLHLEP